MEKGVEEKRKEQEFLKVKVDLPGFQAELSTRDPTRALAELRRIIAALHTDEDAMYEMYTLQELRQTFSTAFTGNEKIMQAVKDLLKQEEEYVTGVIDIPSTATIDFEHDTRTVKVERQDVQRSISQLMGRVETAAVKHGIIHVSGRLGREDKLLILDNIHKCMPTAQLRAFHSDGGRILVECVFFGDFKCDDE